MEKKIEVENVGRPNIFEVNKQYDKDFFVQASKGKIKPTARKTESFFHVRGKRHGK